MGCLKRNKPEYLVIVFDPKTDSFQVSKNLSFLQSQPQRSPR